jgi:hypothetical protein
MNSQKNVINGGFPPIKYCPQKKEDQSKSKERFFANAPRQNINIRQLLSDSIKKPIIITEDSKDNDLEVVSSL